MDKGEANQLTTPEAQIGSQEKKSIIQQTAQERMMNNRLRFPLRSQLVGVGSQTTDWKPTSLANSMLGYPTSYGQLDKINQFDLLHFLLCKAKVGAPDPEQNT